MDFTKISYEILAIDDSMRYVEIIGEDGELLLNKMKQGKHSVKAQRKEELLSLDLYNTKQIEKKFNKTLGKVAFTHVSRTKVHQLVWYHDDLIVYCTCEGHVDNNKIIEISSKIEDILGIGKPVELRNFFEIPN
ncbi:MAG: hypothetical protein D4R72_02315 [Nitrosopumilales archaeon]|nr:MAG: hypothetical protein D4R72_02315 [Nitrosopumilales archaeon]